MGGGGGGDYGMSVAVSLSYVRHFYPTHIDQFQWISSSSFLFMLFHLLIGIFATRGALSTPGFSLGAL